jgi:hypothetical protein
MAAVVIAFFFGVVAVKKAALVNYRHFLLFGYIVAKRQHC